MFCGIMGSRQHVVSVARFILLLRFVSLECVMYCRTWRFSNAGSL